MAAWRYAKTLATTDPIRGSPLANNGCGIVLQGAGGLVIFSY